MTTTPLRLATAFLLALGACAPSEPPTNDSTATAESALQQLACPGGVESMGPNKCMTVPPVTKPPAGPGSVWDAFVVDGVRTQTEFFGAIEFPYAHPGLKLSGGKVFVSIDSNLKQLHVFAQDLPGLRKGELRVYLDHQRFKTAADGDLTFNEPTSEDRAYAIDLLTGAKRVLQPVKSNGVITWQPVPPPLCWPFVCLPETFDGVLGNVTAPNAQGVVRFNAEYNIPLPALMAAPNGTPGVGFALAQFAAPTGVTAGPGIGAFPEELAVAGTKLVAFGTTTVIDQIPASNVIDTKRTLLQTLLFGVPAGVPLRFMTWNIKRFTPFMHFVEKLGSGTPFDDSQVPPELVGQFLAPFDVVAVEEAWDATDFAKIAAAANTARAAAGLTPFFQIGPIDFPQGTGVTFDATTGGVMLLSKFPAELIDSHTYKACRGEDCLKAKGVLHARLNFSTTTVGGSPNVVGASPPQHPDHFVDVYATHMQANEQVCASDAVMALVKSKVLEGLICSPFDPLSITACLLVDSLLQSFHCGDFADDETVRRLQVAELDTFVRQTADPKRPALIMGDFNQDHAFLNLDATGGLTGTYSTLLSQLQLGNVGSPTGVAAPDDRLNPWPVGFGFPWQLDHSDIGRETFSDAAWNSFGRGTFIDAAGLDDPPMGVAKTALSRLDYVFVRAGIQPGSSSFGDVAWMAAKPTNGLPVWSSPFPTAAMPINTLLNRLSDHKPVIFNFQLVPFKPAPKFHPAFSHDFTVHVTSADDSGDDDCFLCGPNDLFTNIQNRVVNVNANTSISFATGATCLDEGNVVSVGVNGCVNTWGFHVKHDPKLNAVTGAGFQLWEEDDSPNSDDFLGTVFGGPTGAMYSVNWPASRIEMRDFDTGLVKPCLDAACGTRWNDLPLAENGNYGFCTRTVPPFLCAELQIHEIAP